jgi:hypothetical protein
MANWLSRATSLFQQPSPPPEPFEVECDCGAKVAGQRTRNYQRPSCPNCERPVFVLPANIYPPPKSRSPGKKKSPPTVSGHKPARSFETAVIANRSTAEQTTTSAPEKKGTPVASPSSIIPELLRKEPRQPLLTPLRATLLAVVSATALMLLGLWHRGRIERARSDASNAADAGMAALRVDDFQKAAQQLERARLAVDLLGRTDAAANAIRRTSREATALDQLATVSLSDMLQEILESKKSGKSNSLPIPTGYKDAWIIFDANLAPAVENARGFVVDAPLQLTDTTVRIEIDSPALKSIIPMLDATESPRMIFAAQMEQMTAPSGAPSSAVLTLNGTTAFLWTSYETLLATGYRPIDAESEQQIRHLLDQQRESQQKN